VLRVVSNKAASLRRRAATDLRVRGVLRADVLEVSLDESGLELWDMVRTLPTRQAQAVALHYGCGLTVDLCAASMECLPETAKTHRTRARRTLARRYGAGGPR